MKQFFSDLLREERDGKFSSKKVWGHVIMFLVCISFAVDGLHFYNINVDLFNSMLIAGSTLLGLRLISSMFKKQPNDKK